jgi:hypothetical protein
MPYISKLTLPEKNEKLNVWIYSCISHFPTPLPSIAWGSGILDIYGPKHLVYQLFGRGVGKWDIHEYIQTFSFSFFSGSVNLDMYGPKHLVYQLFGRGRGKFGTRDICKHLAFKFFRGVETGICMVPNIQFFN